MSANDNDPDAVRMAREFIANGTIGMLAGVDVLARAVIAQHDELVHLNEFIAASKECADANAIITLAEENQRIRAGVTDMIDKLNKGAKISSGMCSWCNEKWLHLDGSDIEEVRAAARLHAYRCAAHPLKIERDRLLELLTEVREENTDLKAAVAAKNSRA